MKRTKRKGSFQSNLPELLSKRPGLGWENMPVKDLEDHRSVEKVRCLISDPLNLMSQRVTEEKMVSSRPAELGEPWVCVHFVRQARRLGIFPNLTAVPVRQVDVR